MLIVDGVKRAADVCFSSAILVATSPLQLCIGLLIRFRMGAPVLFRQVRPGRYARPFTLVKFRSMTTIDPVCGVISDADRLTPTGRFLRSTSLDELPTFWNVLKGDMSLVGPRPLLEEYLTLYSAEQARRHEVRPGITGLAQVNGRNGLGWSDRLALDVVYVDQRSIRLDLVILWRTIGKVLRREGISQAGEATMSRFLGPPRDDAA